MLHYLQNVDFSHDSRYISLVFDFVFFKNFDGNFFLCKLVNTLSYFTKGARANSFACKTHSVKVLNFNLPTR